MRVIGDEIPVEGRGPERVQHKYNAARTVVYEDRDNDLAYAVRAGWMEIGGAPYLASLRMDQAKTWEEFVEACNYSNIPGENMVWADVDGNIGWQSVGIAPIRRSWSGPRPGAGGRALRVGRLPRDPAQAARVQPGQGVLVDGEPEPCPARLRAPRRGGLELERPLPQRPHRRGPGDGPALHRCRK